MIGERLGPHAIERELGTGGMGKVYAATVARDAAGLTRAHDLLLELRDHAPDAYRETILENVPLHCEIMAAWWAQSGAHPDAGASAD